ncbi:MAG TPA: bifunctional DNA primase/polymerase [Kineosporiaceae bacterium]
MTPLEMAARGWPVFLVALAVEADGSVTKRPAIRSAHPPGHTCRGECGELGHGHLDATTDPAKLGAWSSAYHRCAWGISTGPARLVVIDPDRAKGERPQRVLPDQRDDEATPDGVIDGDDVLCWAAERSGGRWPVDTFTVRTVRGGTHAYFVAPTGLVITSGAGLTGGLGWCVDVRAHGGWVVAPGSRCSAGRWDVVDDSPVAPLPAWILVRLIAAGRVPSLARPPAAPPRRPAPPSGLDRRPYVQAALTAELTAVANAAAGCRNVSLNRASYNVGQLVDPYGLTLRAVADALLAAAQACGLGETEAKAAIRSGLAAGRRHPRPTPEPARRAPGGAA